MRSLKRFDWFLIDFGVTFVIEYGKQSSASFI